MPLALPHRQVTSAELWDMVATGVIREDEPVELLDGELVEMTPQGPSHASVVMHLGSLLARVSPSDVHVRFGAPLDCGAHSVPEPDLALVRGIALDYARRHPGGDQTLLAVEVAFSSHSIDRRKVAIYARAGVAEYWLVDLTSRRLEVHREPLPEGHYRVHQLLAGSETVTPPGTAVSWTVDSLLPA